MTKYEEMRAKGPDYMIEVKFGGETLKRIRRMVEGNIGPVIKETMINLPTEEAEKYLTMWEEFTRGIGVVGEPGSTMESPRTLKIVLEGAAALLGRHHTDDEKKAGDHQSAKKMWDALNQRFHFDEK